LLEKWRGVANVVRSLTEKLAGLGRRHEKEDELSRWASLSVFLSPLGQGWPGGMREAVQNSPRTTRDREGVTGVGGSKVTAPVDEDRKVILLRFVVLVSRLTGFRRLSMDITEERSSCWALIE
jgi:hypothetical protein